MKNRLILLITTLFCIIAPAHAFKVPNELKAGALIFAKMSIGVIISAIIIFLCLLFYKKLKDNGKISLPQVKVFNKNSSQKFKCEIDDAATLEEAINTFLKINN